MAKRMKLTDQAAPPLEFDVYDVEFPGDQQQWLVGVDNSPVTPIWFGHRAQHGHNGVLVGTLPRRAFLEGTSPLDWGAPGMAIGRLMGVIEPATRLEDRSASGNRVRTYLERQVGDIAAWPRVGWTVASTRVDASVLHFAGAWLAITHDLPESYVAAIGVGTAPDDLDFITTRGEPYGVNFTAGISIGQSNQLPVGTMPQPNRSDHPHPDLHRFLLPGS